VYFSGTQASIKILCYPAVRGNLFQCTSQASIKILCYPAGRGNLFQCTSQASIEILCYPAGRGNLFGFAASGFYKPVHPTNSKGLKGSVICYVRKTMEESSQDVDTRT